MSLPLVAVSAKEGKMENIDLTLELERTQVPARLSTSLSDKIIESDVFCPENFNFESMLMTAQVGQRE